MKKAIKVLVTLLLCFCTLLALVGCDPGQLDNSGSSSGSSGSSDSTGTTPGTDPEPSSKAPNIVTILVDDMGWSALGCYGSEINTPNIDSLAKYGIRYNQFYNTARCCPSRASLLTGLAPHQTGMGHMVDDSGRVDAYAGTLNQSCVTIAEVLKDAGYSTYMSGKWHVSKNVDDPNGDISSWPLQRGFDKYYGILRGSSSYWNPRTLAEGNTVITPETQLSNAGELALQNYPTDDVPDTFYLTDAISDASVSYIEDHQGEDNPYFLYVAYTAPHWPMEVPQENIDHYDGVYDVGWDEIRQARYERQLEMGIIDESTELSARPSNVSAWDNYGGNKELQSYTMQKYAGLIERMDEGVGQILDAIDRSGEADNTIVMFLSDNGGCSELGTYAGENPSDIRYPVIGEAWANVTNTPFSKYKAYASEGGVTAPLIVRWPAQIEEDQWGSINKSLTSIVDIMATCVDVSGAEYPGYAHGNVIPEMEGVSLAPTFTGDLLGDRYVYAEHEARAMIRNNKWKLLREGGAGGFAVYNQAWKLYDMEKDRSETTDLASQYPEVVDELASAWNQWAIRCDVFPLYNVSGTSSGYPTSLDGKTYYSLQNRSNAAYLQYDASAGAAAENVELVSGTVGLGQQWAFVDAGDGYIKIMNRIDKMCLRDTAEGDAGGNVVVAVSDGSGDDCLWQKVDASGNYYKLQNKATGRVLAYSGTSVRTVADSSDNAVYWQQAVYNDQSLNELVYYVEKSKTIQEDMYVETDVAALKEAAASAYAAALAGASQGEIQQACNSVKEAFNGLASIYDENDGKETKSYMLPNGCDFFNASDWKSADSGETSRTRDQIIDTDGSLIFTDETASRLELFHVVQDSSTGAWRHPGTPAGNLTNAASVYGTTYSYEMTINASGQFDFLVLGGANCFSMDNANSPGVFFRFTEDGKVTIYAAKASAAGAQYSSWGEFSGTSGFNFDEENVITFNITRVDADTLIIELVVNGQKVALAGQDADGMFSADDGFFKAVDYTTSTNSLGQRCGFYAGSGNTVIVSAIEVAGV